MYSCGENVNAFPLIKILDKILLVYCTSFSITIFSHQASIGGITNNLNLGLV